MSRFVIAPLLIAMGFAAAAARGQAVLQSRSKTEGTGASKSLIQTFDLGSEVASYGMTYDISIPEGTPPGKCTSRQWIFRTKIVPLGMTGPSRANWYSQGFFTIRLDGQSIYDTPAAFKTIRAGGADAVVEGIWPTEKGPVQVRFGIRAGDDKLLMQAELPPETKVQRFELVLLCYPQGFDKPHDRHMVTAVRDVPSTYNLAIDRHQEPWALFYDPGMTGNRTRGGPCGLVYVPDETATVAVNLGPYAVFTTLTAKPGERKITVGLWDFTGIGDAPTMREHLLRDGAALAADVQTVAGADWHRALPPVKLGLAYSELLGRLVQERSRPTPYDEMTTEFVTPHVPWAKPLAGGPVRVLVVGPRWRQRETVELAQRLDMQYDTLSLAEPTSITTPELYLYGSYELYGFARKTAAQVLAELQRKLQSPRDCLILSGFQADLIPENLRQAIFDKVRAGAGLILLGGPRELLQPLAKELSPAQWTPPLDTLDRLPGLGKLRAQQKPIWTAQTLGKGRVLAWHYATGTNLLTPALSVEEPDVLDYYEDYQRLAIAAVLWASGRDVPPRLAESARKTPQPTEPGRHIVALELQSPVIQPGGRLAGVVRLRDVPAQATLDVEVWDALGRLLRRQQERPPRAEVPFEFHLGRTPAIVHEVRARLLGPNPSLGSNSGRLLDASHVNFTIVDRAIDDFHFLVWADGGNNVLSHNILRALAEHGVDWIDSTSVSNATRQQTAVQLRNAAIHGLRSIPYITRISSDQISGRVRQPCLTDPAWQAKWTTELRQRARGAATYGPPGYTLGDENYLVSRAQLDVCTSPTCLAGFRGWLQEQYGSLDAINASWGTSYHAWDEAWPATLDEVRAKPERWPRWADHRLFMDGVFTAAHALGRQAIREADPQARVGFDGLFGLDSWHGYDFYRLCRACDLMEIYSLHFMQIEYLRSWRQPDAVCGAWYNELGNRSETWAKRLGWHLLFHGYNSSWYWMAFQTGPALLYPDLRPTPQLQWMQQSHAEIMSGVGKLLLHARRQHDGVAIHYSQAGVHAATLMGRNLEASQTGWARLIEDLGLQYNMLASAEIDQGGLAQYRVLVLPSSAALSPAETQAITRFVEQGGLVLADTMPGILDHHCGLLKTGSLDRLFGVARSGVPRPAVAERVAVQHDGLAGELPMAVADRELKADGAQAWAAADKMPAVLIHRAGQGRTVLLNAAIDPYDGWRKAGRIQLMRQLIGRLLSDMGVQPPVRITVDGADVPGCETVRFVDGGLQYVGIIHDQDCADAKEQVATIELPVESQVYDVRSKQLLGRGRRVTTRLVPGDPKLLALLPYTVQGLTVRPLQTAVPLGREIKLQITLDIGRDRPAGRHCLRVEAIAPNGQTIRHYAQNVLTDRAVAEVAIELALNDSLGVWQFRVTDVATGHSDLASIRAIEDSGH